MDQQSRFSYKWAQFVDLPADAAGLADKELEPLRRVWLEQKGGLEASGLLAPFTERLIREYAIEGGIIERAYTLDRGITQLLIEHGIDASLIPHNKTDRDPNQVARTIQAHQSVVEGLFDLVKGGRPLTTSVIKEMHAALMQHETSIAAIDMLGREVTVRLLKGEYKKLPNNPLRKDGLIHEYCPPEHVASEMDRLLEAHRSHEINGIAPEVQAAWMHHAFTQIHPFQDGNGRIARLIASYILIKHGYFPLTLTNDLDRDIYISALEKADSGNLRPLISLFSEVQRRTFVKVLGIASHVQQQHRGLDQVIIAARHAIESRRHDHAVRLQQAKATARILHQTAIDVLDGLALKLRNDLGPLSPAFQFKTDSETNDGHRRHYFKNQVIQTAKALDYFANVSVYHDWARLILRTDDQSEILVSIHGIGYEYRGILVVTVGFYKRVETEEGERETTETARACDTLFQINYIESPSDAKSRFEGWLQEALTRAMEMWRAGL